MEYSTAIRNYLAKQGHLNTSVPPADMELGLSPSPFLLCYQPGAQPASDPLWCRLHHALVLLSPQASVERNTDTLIAHRVKTCVNK